MAMTVKKLHQELGELIDSGAGGARVIIEEVGEGYFADLDDVNTWMGGNDPTLTLLGERDGRGQVVPVTRWEAHCLIKACEALNSQHVSGTGEYTQEEMTAASNLIPMLTAIAGQVCDPEN